MDAQCLVVPMQRSLLEIISKSIPAAALAIAAITAQPADAQQRSILNTGFENGPQLPAPGGFFIRPDSSTEAWQSTDGEIEIWSSGHQSLPSNSGLYHAELNPNSPIGLYQDVCLQNGETLSWSFAHRNRDDGGSRPDPQTALLEIADQAGSILQSLATQVSFSGTGWQINSGTTTYTGPSGIQRIQFRSTNPGSVGNLLDDISVMLVPYAELASGNGADAEASGGNMIELLISGDVQTPFSIPFTVTGGTAVNGVDYTVTASSVTVPVGNYDGTSASSRVALPITINDDALVENSETITIELASVSTGAVQVASPACLQPARLTATYTINDDDIGPSAIDDFFTAPITGATLIEPLANDGGVAALDPTTVSLSSDGAPRGSVLAADRRSLTVPGEGVWTVDTASGEVTFTPESDFSGRPSPVRYTVDDIAGNPSNLATITLNSPLSASPPRMTAEPDTFSTTDALSGGTTPSVLENDRLNGVPITVLSLITLTPGTAPTPAAGSIVMNADGTITVAPGTTPGSYTYPYEICEVAAPTNCASSVATLVVATLDILDEIEDEVVTILQEDRSTTMAQLSEQMSGFASEAGDRIRARGPAHCLAEVNTLLERSPILFDTDMAVIKPESARVLDQIAGALSGCPSLAYEISGHTDSDASDAYNLALSQRRVEAVLRALAGRGVQTDGVVARGYGERRPIASNATAAGKARNRRVVFAALEGDDYVGPCAADQHLRALDIEANDDGARIDGQFLRDTHECGRDIRKVVKAELSYLETDLGQAQTMMNLSYRRERFVDADSLRGFFLGFYLTQNDISNLAQGEIRGAGFSGGAYGAERFESGLVLDYYLGAAMGKHEFDLDFRLGSGAVLASGDYSYFAAFAGAAISGELELGRKVVTPRLGLDYMYSPETDAQIDTLNGVGVASALDLPSLSGGRIFVELGTEWALEGHDAVLGVTPRIACYQSLSSLDDACGFGGTLSLASTGETTGLIYLLELDAERGDGYSRVAVSGSIARELRAGKLRGSAEIGEDGVTRLAGRYELSF